VLNVSIGRNGVVQYSFMLNSEVSAVYFKQVLRVINIVYNSANCDYNDHKRMMGPQSSQVIWLQDFSCSTFVQTNVKFIQIRDIHLESAGLVQVR
jgi:hypothetical protein